MERIEETMEEVGNSISLTTITTITAFCLGCVSSIPSIRWLCLYSFPTIAIDFVYQITFFAAIIVLDEQRVQANRRDCCICLTASPHGYDENKQLEDDDEDDDNDGGDGLANRRINHRRRAFRSPNRRRTKTEECCSSEDDSSCSYNQRQAPQAEAATTMQQKHQIVEEDVDDDTEEEEEEENIKAHIADRFMGWYADQLLRPTVKVCVLIAFAAFLAGCCFSATKLTQDFQAAEFLSDDSYALGFNMAGQLYREYSIRVPAYFRFVDQSNPEVQQQMQNYIDDLAALPQFGREPEICWFRDFQKLRHGTSDMFADYQYIFGEDMNFTFDEQIDIMLSVPEVKRLYGSQIARDGDGKIVLSRCSLTATNLDFNIVRDQVDALEDLYDLAAEQEVNEGLEPKDYRFFAYEGGMFFLWEFYTTAVKELTFTTITGVVAVSIIGFLLVPHWSSVLFVTPLTMVLYVNLLGKYCVVLLRYLLRLM